MSRVEWIAAEADERNRAVNEEGLSFQRCQNPETEESAEDWEHERERKIYRTRTILMLRKYMQYSIETGRLPSVLGQEFFRAKVTTYTVTTFEDRVIFVHDMERCLNRLDEFSRQLIGRRVLQEHDRWATAKLLHCNEKTVRRLTPLALDMLSEILLDVGLLQRVDSMSRKSCQGGIESQFDVSDCEDGENKI
jgi:DNA-directed RNA polymerase specialized sigma24 family protein